MASTYTSRIRLTKQGDGDDSPEYEFLIDEQTENDGLFTYHLDNSVDSQIYPDDDYKIKIGVILNISYQGRINYFIN